MRTGSEIDRAPSLRIGVRAPGRSAALLSGGAAPESAAARALRVYPLEVAELARTASVGTSLADQEKGSWWQTLPGILTSAAAVIAAIGGLIGVLHQYGVFGRQERAASADRSGERPPAVTSLPAPDAPARSGAGTQAEAERAPAPREAQAGHLVYRILDVTREPYASGPGGKTTRVALRLRVRVTDVMGMSDYVDGTTVRLLADGARLTPSNGLNEAVYERQSIEIEPFFVIPADASRVELLVGRDPDATAKIPLTRADTRG
jgi:hypothetical protein